MNKLRFIGAACLYISTIYLPNLAYANIISYDFSGSVSHNNIDNIDGTVMSGTITYDTSVSGSAFFLPDVTRYIYRPPLGILGISISISSGLEFELDPTAGFVIDVGDNHQNSSFAYDCNYYLPSCDFVSIFSSSAGLSGLYDLNMWFAGPGDTHDSSSLPIDFDAFTSQSAGLLFIENPNDITEFLTANIESVQVVVPVPAPTVIWLFGSGLIGLIGVAKHKKI